MSLVYYLRLSAAWLHIFFILIRNENGVEMKRILFELISDSNGRSDEMAVLSIIGVLSFIGLEIFTVLFRHQSFEPERFGMGLGSAIAAGAIGMGLSSRFGD